MSLYAESPCPGTVESASGPDTIIAFLNKPYQSREADIDQV